MGNLNGKLWGKSACDNGGAVVFCMNEKSNAKLKKFCYIRKYCVIESIKIQKIKMPNSANLFWHSFPNEEKKRFLRENSMPFVKAATSAIRFDTKYSAVCMVCVVQALGNDALVQTEDIFKKQCQIG